jgi:hypothetical protein
MKIGLRRVSAAAIILGSVLFLVGFFFPISGRVFAATSAADKLEIITESAGAWTATQVLLGLGAVLTLVGVALLAYDARDRSVAVLLWTGTVILMVGAGFWLWYVYARAADPAAFAVGALPVWPLPVSFVLTEVGLALFGVGLIVGPYTSWVGWIVVVSMVLLLVLTLALGDVPEFVLYVVTLLAGVVLLLSREGLRQDRPALRQRPS